MPRLAAALRETVPEEQRDSFDSLVNRLGSVPPYGPGSVMIHVPDPCKMVYELNDYLRDSSTLSPRISELAMLVTARELHCQHIWNAHTRAGRAAGLSDETIDGLRNNDTVPTLAADGAAVISYGREFFRTHRVSRGAFQAVQEQLGDRGVVELTMLMGSYGMLAFCINAFDPVLAPNSGEPALPV